MIKLYRFIPDQVDAKTTALCGLCAQAYDNQGYDLEVAEDETDQECRICVDNGYDDQASEPCVEGGFQC